jgi:predicted AlkP superfamily phosphohydrolase/phosphomutase
MKMDTGMVSAKRKVVIFGLDGATLDLIIPWAAEGLLPTLSRLIDTGTSGSLQSTYPPITGPAWGSFMTGKSPGRHSIFEFFKRVPGTYRQVLNSFNDLDGRTLWRILSEAGYSVGVMGVPMTYPPEILNGFLISGLLTPPAARDFAYPPEILQELNSKVGRYRLRHDEKYRRSDPGPFLREQYEILENNTQSALYLMRNKPWDFFMLHLLGTDRIQHEFWHVLDSNHPQHDPKERQRLGNVVLKFYQAVDASLGRILDALDDTTVVFVVSDHGFGPIHKFININVWLLKQGYLHLKRTPDTAIRYGLFRIGFNYARVGRWILKLGIGKAAKRVGRARREDWQRRVFLSFHDVDWSRTRAFSMGNYGQIYINLKGREKHGIISPGAQYRNVISVLSRSLMSLQDPETGEQIVQRIHKPIELYSGPYSNRAPDLMFDTREQYKAFGLTDFSSPHVFEPVYGSTGHHRLHGVLIAHGKGVIRTKSSINGARIEDITPTVLYLMGHEISSAMDGNVLLDLFQPDFVRSHQVLYQQDDDQGERTNPEAYSEEDEAVLRDWLRSLGYVN